MRSFARGFTLIELCISVAFVGVLAALALPNYQIMTSRAHDLAALSDYRHIKTIIAAEELANEGLRNFNIRRRRGSVPLPGPLSRAWLSEGVILDYATKRTSRGRKILALQLSHPSGRFIYRYTEIDGRINEQVIRRRGRV